MQRILKNYLFWTYPRGSLHYDVMVTLILIFLFVSPRLINYHDRPQETLTSTKDILVRPTGPNAWTCCSASKPFPAASRSIAIGRRRMPADG
jgi:hypothetical protein